MRKYFMIGVALAALSAPVTSVQAVNLLTASGGGYGQQAMAPNDDGSTGRLELPFQIDFYGQTYNDFWINNNGNLTFSSPTGTFTPFALGNLTQAMIAPYWADVDTRGVGSGQVYVDSFAPGQLNVTWDQVGYFGSHVDKLNSFQVNLYQIGNTGDFDIEFRYSNLEWTTGDASEGINGLGGVPAVAGYTNGNGVSVLQPGSFLSPGALNMAVESNLTNPEPGRWLYNIRNASPPPAQGSTPQNPILPTSNAPNDGYNFTFNVSAETVYFIDPPVATGYDYSVDGNLFTSAIFTSPLVDADGYELLSADGLTSLGNVLINQTFTFAAPVSAFQLRGINPANLVSPGDPLGFVSGFTFQNTGTVTVTQTPFVENFTPPSGVPEPATWALMLLGFAGVGASMRRKQAARVRFAF